MLSMAVSMKFHAYETVTNEFHSHERNLFSLPCHPFCIIFNADGSSIESGLSIQMLFRIQ
jgi:hypothetical protein